MRQPAKLAAICASAALLAACGEKDKATEDTVLVEPRADERTAPAAAERVIDPTKIATDVMLAAFVNTTEQFNVENARIDFEKSGDSTGAYTLYIEDYGKRAASVEQVQQHNQSAQIVRYWDGKYSYVTEEQDGVVTTSSIRFANLEPSVMLRSSPTQLITLGYEDAGWREIAGVQCRMWRSDKVGNEICVWKGVEVIARMNRMKNGDYTIVRKAVAVEEGVAIPADIKALANSTQLQLQSP